MVSNSDNNSVNFKPISNKVNPLLLGHKSNEADFLSAFKSGNFHHAWLLVGDKGVGKATFAYRVARFIFATSPEPENKPMEFWTPVKRVKKSKSAAVKESSVKSENQDDMLFDLDDNDKSSSLDFDLSDDLELSSDDENIDNENDFYDDADDLHFNNQSESYLNEKRLNASSLQIDANDKIFDQIILGTFPDLKVVEPNYEAGKSVIPIEDIINLKEFFSVSSSLGDYRVVIIDAVDDLNEKAANALLKILEEPPAKTLFLLVCHNLHNILDTIKSRCRILKFSALDDEVVERLLVDNIPSISSDLLNELINFSNGSIGSAFDLYRLDFMNIILDMNNIITNIKNCSAVDLNKFANDIAKNNDKYLIFNSLVRRFIDFAIKYNFDSNCLNSLSNVDKNIINIISGNCSDKDLNVNRLFDIRAFIDNLFKKTLLVNLEKESTIILTLKKLGGVDVS